MLSRRFVLSCSIAPSLLTVGVVVEQGHQGIQYDYYEDKADKSVTNECKQPEYTTEGKHIKAKLADGEAATVKIARAENEAKGVAFAKANFRDFLKNPKTGSIAKALKTFLFNGSAKHGVPELFKTGALNVHNGSCKDVNKWVIINPDAATETSSKSPYSCQDCGYDPGTDIIADIVKFVNTVNAQDPVQAKHVPAVWCHNPLPIYNDKKILTSETWRETGGYFNVLRCTESAYSVIGFAGEKKGTCYPYHVHKSYELYWTIGGKAEWMPKDHPFDGYQMNNATHWLHKHDPTVSHEIQTKESHTTQIYFWSMSGTDELKENKYDVDESIFDLDEKKKLSSCYHK